MYLIEGGKHHLNAEEYGNLCRSRNYARVKSDRKYKACKQGTNMEGKNYHVSAINTKIYGNDVKIKVKRVRKPKKGQLYSGLLAHYHINVDPDLGDSKVSS